MIVIVIGLLRAMLSGLYRHQRARVYMESVYREGNIISGLPSLCSTQRRVPSGHGPKFWVLYLHASIVRTMYIVRLSGYPIIQDSLRRFQPMLYFGLLRAHLFLGSFPAFGYLRPITVIFCLWAKFSPWLQSARLWPVNTLGRFHVEKTRWAVFIELSNTNNTRPVIVHE